MFYDVGGWEECREKSGKCYVISHCLESGCPVLEWLDELKNLSLFRVTDDPHINKSILNFILKISYVVLFNLNVKYFSRKLPDFMQCHSVSKFLFVPVSNKIHTMQIMMTVQKLCNTTGVIRPMGYCKTLYFRVHLIFVHRVKSLY